jgi:hypothetical protein
MVKIGDDNQTSVWVRIVARPPAPKMDGFDVRGFEVGRVYLVEARVANYLILAGYAERERQP